MKVFIEEKRFDSKIIFKDASFSIPKLSHTAVVGPSGCGKTTLMRILSGLDCDFKGTIEDKAEFPLILFQEDRLQERISVLSNLMAVTDDRSKALEMLSLLSLRGEEKSIVHTLSGGMKRRVAIARVLLLDSDYLFLDEPFRALDSKLRTVASKLILEYAKGRTLVFVTHDEGDLTLLEADSVIKLG